MKRETLLTAAVLAAAATTGSTPRPQMEFVPQPGLELTGFWGDALDKLETAWLPHCWKKLGGTMNGLQRNLAEATMLALERHPDRADLARALERWIEKDIAAQKPDGYVGRCEPHYVEFHAHELYGQGYFLEAAVRHMAFTHGRDRRYFDAAKRLADFLASVFDPPPKRTFTDGHPGVEKALLTFADAVDRWDGPGKGAPYAALARYFLRHQSDLPEYRSEYCQSHVPATEMAEAVGHAVRGTYFYAGMAGAAWRCGDADLAVAVRRIFDNAIDRKEYLTGGVGGRWERESFAPDWSLPNETGYLEGCAGCGMYDWCTEMARLDGLGRWEDVRERVVYNNLLGVFSEDFTRYSYQNPTAAANVRHPWHTLPCCVGNVPRVLEDFKNRMYAVDPGGETLYLIHFIASKGGRATVRGVDLRLDLETDYPAGGAVRLTVTAAAPVDFDLCIRHPDRTESALYRADPPVEHGWRRRRVSVGTSPATVDVVLPLPLQRVTCDGRVKDNEGLVAWQQGPLVYAWEGEGFKTRVPYYRRMNGAGPSRVWLPTDGRADSAATVEGRWFRNTGCPVDAVGRKVEKAFFLEKP